MSVELAFKNMSFHHPHLTFGTVPCSASMKIKHHPGIIEDLYPELALVII